MAVLQQQALSRFNSQPKRLRKVHKTMRGYGESWQYSVFYCVLKAIDRVRLENDLREVMNMKEDQVLIIDLGSDEEAARDSAKVLGERLPEAMGTMVVI